MPPRTSYTCTRCTATAAIPDDGNHAPLWDAGWRWLGPQWDGRKVGPDLVSCPNCPQVIVVTEDGRHVRGPGASAPAPAAN